MAMARMPCIQVMQNGEGCVSGVCSLVPAALPCRGGSRSPAVKGGRGGGGGHGAKVWCGVVWCGVVWYAEGAVTRRQWPGCLPTGTGKRAGLCVLCARRVYVRRSWWREGEPGRPGRLALGDRPHSRSSRCTPSRSACWCRRSSCNAHAIVLPGPRRAFSNVARALAWAYQTRMDSSMTWRRNSVPSAWGPVHSRWARCIEGVRRAAAHCSSIAGSHCWWRTGAARVPTFWSSHVASHRRAGPHSWDWAEQAHRWGAVSGCAPQRRQVWCGVVWCGVVWCGVVWCGVVWCGVVWCGVVWCGVVWCGVVWCGGPKALLPKGKGRDVYPRVQVNGLGCVCCVRAVCKCVVA